jgi:hypothetical protein
MLRVKIKNESSDKRGLKTKQIAIKKIKIKYDIK